MIRRSPRQPPDRADRPLRISIRSAQRLRDYYLFIPGSIAPDMPAPVLLLLHGSYSTPLDVLPQWTEVAERGGIILVAPKSFADYGWRIHDDPPALLRDVVDDLAARRPIDRRRLYLFGHSAGAVHALTLGLLESQYFAAVAVHAGAWTQRDYFIDSPQDPVDDDRDQTGVQLKDANATEAAARGRLRDVDHHEGTRSPYTTEAPAEPRRLGAAPLTPQVAGIFEL